MREKTTGVYEQYIRCTMCRYEQVLPGVTTPELERAKRRVMKMAERAQYEIDRHGVMSGSTSKSLRRLRKRRDGLMGEVYARNKEASAAGAD